MSQVDPIDYPSQIASFLPRFFRHKISEVGALPNRETQRTSWGVLVFADISGFTRITEGLSEQGARGAEQLVGMLNAFFSPMIDIVELYGGDIVAFAGDAAIILWPVDEEDRRRETVHAALACAINIHRRLNGFDAGAGPIALRVSVGVGPVNIFELGGHQDYWLPVVDGEGLDDVVAIHAAADTQTVSASAGVVTVAGPGPEFELDAEAGYRLISCDETSTTQRPWPTIGADEESLLQPLVPRIVRDRLLAGQSDFLSEFRHTTIVFVRFEATQAGELGDSQFAVSNTQQIIARFEGALYQCLRDDKGFVLIGAFGMPPYAHEDNAARAVLAALAIRDRLSERGQVSIGLSSGVLFCGAYGTVARQQYSLVGMAINTSARLMETEAASVVCDEPTVNEARRDLEFDTLPPVTLKGFAAQLPVFRPVGRLTAVKTAGSLVGREVELEQMMAFAQRVVEKPFVIEAEAGMGKSHLLQTFVDQIQQGDLETVIFHADAIEQKTPYFALRRWFAEAVQSVGVEALTARLEEASRPLLPLLRAVVPVDLVDNATTENLVGKDRQDLTNRLLAEILNIAVDGRPPLVVFEDGHWLDSATWSFFTYLVHEVGEIGVLLATRPPLTASPEYQALREPEAAEFLALKGITDDGIGRLVARQFGIDALPTDILSLIVSRSDGNPFYALELGYSLRDLKQVVIEDGEMRLAEGLELETLEVPYSLDGLITSRIDVLPVSTQLTAKIASVVGRLFEDPMVEALQPVSDDEATERHLDRLCTADIVLQHADTNTPMHVFSHDMTRLTVYGLLTFSQRRALNQAAALYLQRSFADLEPLYPRLAVHFGEAEMPQEELHVVMQAGRSAFKLYALTEARDFLERALELDKQLNQCLSDLERTEVHRNLCATYYGLSDYERVYASSQAALGAAHFRRLWGTAGIPVEIGITVWQSLKERVTGRRAQMQTGDQAETTLYALQSLGDTTPAMLLDGLMGRYLEAAIKGHNIGALVEPDSLASAAQIGYGLGLAYAGVYTAAERQLRRGLTSCEEGTSEVWTYGGYMALGLFLSMTGRPREAIFWLEKAAQPPKDPATFIWHYRGVFTLGDVQLCVGDFASAASSLAAAVDMMRKGQPSDLGLMLALQGLAFLRTGRDDEAWPLIEEAISYSPDGKDGLAIAASSGVKAEALICQDKYPEALALVDKITEIAERGNDLHGHHQGMHPYSSAASVYLFVLEQGDRLQVPADVRNDVSRKLTSLLKRFQRYVGTYPGAKGRLAMFRSRALQQFGSFRAANWRWRAATWSEQCSDPYALGFARLQLGLYGKNVDQIQQLRAAARIFEKYGMVHERQQVLLD